MRSKDAQKQLARTSLNCSALVFLLITRYEITFINRGEATKRSKDRKINGKWKGNNVQLNYLKYLQLIAAIPNYLKGKAQTTSTTNRNILTINVDVKITTNYFRKKLGQSLPLLKHGVDVFRTLTLVGKRSYTKFTKQRVTKS